MIWLSLLLACDPAPDASVGVTPTAVEPLPCDACGGACEAAQLDYADATHVVGPVVHEDLPPAGGPHAFCWSAWGVHDEPVPLEGWVHNLEHGGVVFLYSCDDCAEEIDAMAALVDEVGAFALMTPYPELPSRFAVVAWGYRLTTDCFDADAFRAFYDERVDRAPESVPGGPPASCEE